MRPVGRECLAWAGSDPEHAARDCESVERGHHPSSCPQPQANRPHRTEPCAVPAGVTYLRHCGDGPGVRGALRPLRASHCITICHDRRYRYQEQNRGLEQTATTACPHGLVPSFDRQNTGLAVRPAPAAPLLRRRNNGPNVADPRRNRTPPAPASSGEAIDARYPPQSYH